THQKIRGVGEPLLLLGHCQDLRPPARRVVFLISEDQPLLVNLDARPVPRADASEKSHPTDATDTNTQQPAGHFFQLALVEAKDERHQHDNPEPATDEPEEETSHLVSSRGAEHSLLGAQVSFKRRQLSTRRHCVSVSSRGTLATRDHVALRPCADTQLSLPPA